MRWIDIVLPTAEEAPATHQLLDRAQDMLDGIPELQDQKGLDAPAVTARAEQVGRLLFEAIQAHQPDAFRPDAGRDGATTPGKIDRVGYHVVAKDHRLGLPWHWLHNGVAYLIDRFPLAAANHGSHLQNSQNPRLWMQRQTNELMNSTPTDDRARPEILFVPGHGKDEIRRLMFREAEGIDDALTALPSPVARLRIPGAVTPGLLAARAMLYQALHFAAPTSQPPEISQAGEQRWLAGLMAAAGKPEADGVDELVGGDLEIVGVDPVEAALDQALEAYSRRKVATTVASSGTVPGWLLDDGPVAPERLGRDGCLPPLVFSNSWCSLHWLGRRFLDAGASTFLGTALPVFSRPARHFAALFYEELGRGGCVGEAHQQAALRLRERLGPEHPAWLAHGVQGFGTLRLGDL